MNEGEKRNDVAGEKLLTVKVGTKTRMKKSWMVKRLVGEKLEIFLGKAGECGTQSWVGTNGSRIFPARPGA